MFKAGVVWTNRLITAPYLRMQFRAWHIVGIIIVFLVLSVLCVKRSLSACQPHQSQATFCCMAKVLGKTH